MGKGGGKPSPAWDPAGRAAPAPSAAGAVTRQLSRGWGDLCILLTLHSCGRKNNNPPLLRNPICWLRRPPLTFAKSTSLRSSTVLGRENKTAWMTVSFCNERSRNELKAGKWGFIFELSMGLFWESPGKRCISQRAKLLSSGSPWDLAQQFV